MCKYAARANPARLTWRCRIYSSEHLESRAVLNQDEVRFAIRPSRKRRITIDFVPSQLIHVCVVTRVLVD